jgi:SNF2 family DNA or RNA helicase
VELYKDILVRKAVGKDKKFYMNVLMQLRKACNHPYLFEGIEEEGLPVLGEHLIHTSGKMSVLDKLLMKLHVIFIL